MKRWKYLLNEHCPKCGCKLYYKKDTQLYECALYDENPTGHFSCDFSITPRRLKDLQYKISTGQVLQEFDHDNSERLNNLGTNYPQ